MAEVVFEPKQNFIVEAYNSSYGFGRIALSHSAIKVLISHVILLSDSAASFGRRPMPRYNSESQYLESFHDQSAHFTRDIIFVF